MILFNSCILNCDSEFINCLEHLPMLIPDFLSVSCLKYTAIILNNSRMAIMGQSKFFQLFSYRNCSIRKALFVNSRWYEIEKVNPTVSDGKFMPKNVNVWRNIYMDFFFEFLNEILGIWFLTYAALLLITIWACFIVWNLVYDADLLWIISST